MLRNFFARFGATRLLSLRASHVVSFGAIFNLLSGLACLICWQQGWPVLIRSRGAIMCGDTAILCVLAGVGLLAAARKKYTVTRIIGILLAVAANLHFTADLAGFTVSVHNLFPKITASILPPAEVACVQMAPSTALVFIFFGCALALLSRRMSNQVLAAKAAIGVVIFAIGMIVLSGYLKGDLFGTFGSPISHMAVLTALCAVMLGVSLCALCSLHSCAMSEELSPSSIAIGAIGLILIFGGTDTATVVRVRAALLSDSSLEVTYSQIRAVEKTIDSIRKAESNKRAFLLTRDDKFLASFKMAMAALRGSLGREELHSIPDWQKRSLQNLIAARMTQLDTTIALERLGHHNEAVEFVKSGGGAVLSERIETEIESLLDGLETEAVSRKEARQILMQNLINVVLGSYVVAILLVAATVLLARLEARQHERSSLRAAGTPFSEPISERASKTAVGNASSQRTVLLVEDSEDIMLLVKHALDRHGYGRYRLTWANCLKESFRELTKGGVDVVLLDLGLPESTGLISYACVRGCAPEVPVLVMTGDESRQTEDSIIAAGVDGYLLKQQISGSQLVEALEAVLRSQRRPPQLNLKRIAFGV